MIKIKKKFDNAINKFKGRIEKLEKENERDRAKVIELEKAYRLSVIEDDGQDKDIDAQLKSKRNLIAEREKQIELLEEGKHPVMVKAANDAAREYAKEREKQRAKGEKLNADLQKSKVAYLDSVAKAYKEDRELVSQRNEVRAFLKQADESVIEELLLGTDRDVRMSELPGDINWYSCLVFEHEMMAYLKK